eukprot:gene1112-649_t
MSAPTSHFSEFLFSEYFYIFEKQANNNTTATKMNDYYLQ